MLFGVFAGQCDCILLQSLISTCELGLMGKRGIRFFCEGESIMAKKSRSEKASGQAQARKQNDRERTRTKRQVPQGAMNGGASQKGGKSPS